MKVIAINGSPRKNWNTANCWRMLLKEQKTKVLIPNLYICMICSTKVVEVVWYAKGRIQKAMGCAV